MDSIIQELKDARALLRGVQQQLADFPTTVRKVGGLQAAGAALSTALTRTKQAITSLERSQR